jgi:hypothetical protein
VLTAGFAVAALALLISLPFWLPPAVVALRVRIFAMVNGDDVITIPGRLVGAEQFKRVYADPAADGRSRGAALSDLFWYWLAPGPEVHQEHLELGPRYAEVSITTRRILHVSHDRAAAMAARCAATVLDELKVRGARLVRLRDVLMPVWALFYYELAFGQRCPPVARRLVVDNADDVVTALKCCGLRHMRRRDRLTEFLVDQVRAGAVAHELPRQLSAVEQALYLQGTFFNTAVVQMSEATAHLLMAIARHEPVRARLLADPSDDRYLDRVIDETLRLYPLFGIAHRITSAEIVVDDRVTIPPGSVLCFNYPQYHRTGFEGAARFDPDRWRRLPVKAVNHVPFGVAANRPCPAWHLAPVTMRAVVREVLGRVDLRTSAAHTRSLPNRGPCLLWPLAAPPGRVRRAALLGFVLLRDRAEDVWRSLVQLVLGTYMVIDARRLRLCTRYFESRPVATDPGGPGSSP